MSGQTVLAVFGVFGGIAALTQAVWVIVAAVRGKTTARARAEAAQASINVAQAEQSLPHVARSLELGNIGDAVSIQQNIINGLREHVTWQDEQIANRDRRITALEGLVEDLETRLETAEQALAEAREGFNAVRAHLATDPDHGTVGP